MCVLELVVNYYEALYEREESVRFIILIRHYWPYRYVSLFAIYLYMWHALSVAQGKIMKYVRLTAIIQIRIQGSHCSGFNSVQPFSMLYSTF